MFNILTDKMPTEILGCKIHTDVETCLRSLELIEDVLIEDEIRGAGLLHLMFYNEYPNDIEKALGQVLLFLSCETKSQDSSAKLSKNSEFEVDSLDEKTHIESKERAFDYVIDNNVIYSSMKSYYGYSLQIENLHWWEFNVLLLNMKDTPFNDLVHYRTCDINKLPEYQRKEYRSIRNKVRLPQKIDELYIENMKLLYPDDWKGRVEKEVENRRSMLH